MKSQRHFTIMDIVANQRISTQEELCEALKKRGFDVTQATVSRDMKEVQLIKIPDAEGYRYALSDSSGLSTSLERMKRVFQDSVLNVDFSENIILINTLPGAANSVASLLDFSDQPHILGTVAGDDTILVVIKPKKAVAGVMAFFDKLLK